MTRRQIKICNVIFMVISALNIGSLLGSGNLFWMIINTILFIANLIMFSINGGFD